MAAVRSVVNTLEIHSESDYDAFADFAASLANLSGEICRKYFRRNIVIEDKDDESPVTNADREVEETLRQAIHAQFPGHSVFGEEFGLTIGTGEEKRLLWVLDPIDGTLSFITGKPLFATLIALLYDGEPIVGVIDQPILHDRWIGAKNRPTLHNDTPIRTRNCLSLSKAYMYSVSPDMFLDHRQGPFERLSPNVKNHIWGGDAYVYGLLADGMVDIVLDTNMKVYDYMAYVPIIEGAGGVITDWCGNRLIWDGVALDGAEIWAEETLACANSDLHKAALKQIGWKISSVTTDTD